MVAAMAAAEIVEVALAGPEEDKSFFIINQLKVPLIKFGGTFLSH